MVHALMEHTQLEKKGGWRDGGRGGVGRGGGVGGRRGGESFLIKLYT